MDSARVAALDAIAAARRELADVIASASSTTGDDEHDPEGATIGFERAQAQASLERAVGRLAQIDEARERQRAGSYGVCGGCGAAIGAARLAARPAADRCIRCASAQH